MTKYDIFGLCRKIRIDAHFLLEGWSVYLNQIVAKDDQNVLNYVQVFPNSHHQSEIKLLNKFLINK